MITLQIMKVNWRKDNASYIDKRCKRTEIKVVLKAKAGENGKLFGSVTSKDVAEALTSQHHIKLDKKKFVMPDGIKTLGTTTVDVKIYTGVVGKLNVVVEQI